ncbi:Sak single strand annealing protein [Snodgrassella alvi]|uniref:SSAP RNA binding domain-containing protein n=1 Tax=Snodgrassella alvi TaxID=1196083 RepID=A0A855FZL0_9NEIS|nr:DUF1071 domain-containing protein [Snodgrassella alvi]PIT11662.1 hypothetical protein BGI30_04060 [Snodgrassella alvi]PIT55306.1 hypothetical protein BHC59_11130 [Snodgrassella alvi]PIT62556.1 hypothetical protein BHC57_01090 [Snodgrassella alvi]
METKKPEFAQTVWKTLSNINLESKVLHKKNSQPYLPWAVAWQMLMEYYPSSSYEFGKVHYYGNKTCEVSITVTCKQGSDELTRSMSRPVHDEAYNSIVNPTSTQINMAKMRCLEKCIAMFGLGIRLHVAGESFISNIAEDKAPLHQKFASELSMLNSKEDVMSWYANKQAEFKDDKEILKIVIDARHNRLSQFSKVD